MPFAVILFLVLVCRCQAVPEQMKGTASIKDDPLEDKLVSLLREHEARTASLLRQQDTKLQHLTHLLRQQDTKLQHLTHLLRYQEEKLSSQDDLLCQQQQKLFHQDDLLQKQDQKLSDQNNLVHHQQQKLSYQDDLLHQHQQTLSMQEDTLRQQNQKLSHQDRLLREQRKELSTLSALVQQQKRKSQFLNNRRFNSPLIPDKHSQQGTKNMSQGKTHLPISTSDSTTHDVMSRSDDAGPLEAVVSHLSQRVTEMGADIQTLKNSNTQQDLAIQDAQSSTFVHWGSSTCTSLSHTVYSGVVGGSWYGHTGAASNYLCLTMSPVFSSRSIPHYKALLYGGEYETEDSHQDLDPVCSVCRSTLSTTVMIPGTSNCTPGWHLQYSGFLMAERVDLHAGSEYICVDSKLESNAHDNSNENGKLLYYTVTQCGALPCGPYANNKVVTCAVCSK